VSHVHSDHQKVRRVFGDRPATALDVGLRKMAAWVHARGAQTGVPFESIEITKNLPSTWRIS
jgi:hypothetical protein